ncbi:MAG TPA: FG-GAP-like repeat-containing protein [Mucilaginibacter sp.]|jgi:photosystem II stability/assembly factor-like uncharacterized protein|nr:FG-GAP-like repeat-containing protein [Mucilaginibacter sp.]
MLFRNQNASPTRKKRHSLFIAFFLLFSGWFLPAQAQFHQIHIEPDVDHARKLSFLTASQGFVAFDKYVGFTTDSGRTFTQKTITTSNVDYSGNPVNLTFGFTINGVKAFDSNNIFVYGDYGFQPTILHSTDGGNTFKIVFFVATDPASSTPTITDLVFPQNDNIGYAIYANYVIKTTDGGLTWAENAVINDTNYTNLQFIDDTHGYAFGPNAYVMSYTTDGSRWFLLASTGGTLQCAFFLSTTRAWACNTDGSVYMTPDGGAGWTLQTIPSLSNIVLTKMQFVNDSTGYAISAGFDVYKTSNSGKIWERLPRNTSYHYLGYSLNDLQVMNNFIWAAGGHGYIALSNNNGGPTVPLPLFTTDTTGYFNTGVVKLVNYSRSGYNYNWFVNGKSISTSYNTSYVHNPNHFYDTITLINTNGKYKDTLTQYGNHYYEVIPTSFTPATAKQGDVVTITGARLDYTIGVEFGGVPAASFNIVSPSTVTAVVGTGASGKVSVYSALNTGSLPGFTFFLPPAIKSFSPLTAQGGATITLTGQYFTGATSVTFGGVAATSFTVVSDTQITAVLGKGSTGSITVTTPGGPGSITGFTMLPIIDSFTPASGGAGTSISISGSGLDAPTAVTIGGVGVQSFVADSVGHITAVAGAGATGVITVTTLAGSFSSTASFTYYNQPVITSFAPLTAKIGDVITINGQYFTGTTSVTFGGVAAASFTVISDTQLTAVLGSGSSGTVAVTNPGGMGSITGFSQTPVIDSFTPLTGGGGTDISLNGSGFSGATAVTIGGTPVLSFVVDSASHITAIAGAGASGIIRVSTPSGNCSSTASFTYYYPPSIASFAPLTGPVGATITINGTHFSTTATDNVVYFGAVRATVLSAAANALTVTVPAGATYGFITVRTNNLDGVSRLPFTVTFANGGTLDANSFPATTLKIAPAAGTSPIVADIDGDGKPDILTRNQTGINGFSIQLNTGIPGNFTYTQQNIDGINAYAFALADLDGDGLPELLVTNNTSSKIVIYHNISTPGHVAFGDTVAITPTSFSTFSMAIAAADMDGDGKPDIVVTNSNGLSEIDLYRNTSQPGKLSFDTVFPLGGTADSFTIADFDGDGKPDLLATFNNSSGGIDVLRNTSTPGSFSFDRVPGVFPANPYPICAGDIDGDGKLDVIILDRQSNYIDVYRNLSSPGKVSFAAMTTYAVPAWPVNAMMADFDGDGKPDIAVSAVDVNTPGNSVATIFKNISTPGKISLLPAVNYATGITIGDLMAAADVDGDGKADLLFSTDGQSLQALINQVKPSPMILSMTPTIGIAGDTVNIKGFNLVSATAVNFGGVAAASFKVNADQSITATLGGGATGTVQVINPAGTGTGPNFVYGNIPSITSFTPTTGNAGISVTITGKNFDTDPANNVVYFGGAKATITSASATQLVVTAPGGTTYQPIAVATHNFIAYSALPFNLTFKGDATLDAQSFSKKFTLPGSMVTAADMDGDGNLDLLFMSPNNELVVARSRGLKDSVAFDANAIVATGLNISHIYVADIDADGKPDIVCLTTSPAAIIVYRNTSSGSNLSFDAGVPLPTGGAAYAYLTINDADGDGLPDIVSTSFGQQSVIVYRNNTTAGKISFAPPVYHNVGNASDNAVLTDLNGDGKTEIVSCGTENVSLSITNNASTPGNFNFGATTVLSAGTGGLLQVADFDGDGKPDIAAAFDYYFQPTPTFFRNTGTGKLAFSQVVISKDIAPTAVIAGDLNGDGKPEFIAVDPGFQRLAVMVNTSTPGTISFNKDYFIANRDPVSGNGTTEAYSQVAAGDVDQDGKTDLIISANGTITIYRNIRATLTTLPDTDLKVTFTSLSCRGTNDGSIKLTAAVSAPYTATVSDQSGNVIATGNFTTTYSATSLDTGYYNICVTDADIPGFQQCFSGRLSEPADLSAYSVVNNEKQTADLHLSGGVSYTIQVNDQTYQTNQSDYTVPLQKGNNKLTITTDKECQGVFIQRITIGNTMVIYPNPFVAGVQIDVGDSQAPAGMVEIVDVLGRNVFKDNITNDYGKLNMDLSQLKSGFYVVTLTIDNTKSVYKLWKK